MSPKISLFAKIVLMLDDIDMIRQALDIMVAYPVKSRDEAKQLKVLLHTLAVDAMSPSRLDGRRFWHGLLHFQCNQLDLEGDPEDQVFRLDALIGAGLEWQHRYCEAQDLYEDSYPEILTPGQFYSKRKPRVLGYLDKKTFKEFPLALQARVRLQRSYVELYKARDRTRKVQQTLPYKVAAEIAGRWSFRFADRYDLCLRASEGQGNQEVEKAWRNRAEETDSVEINGITYQIHGDSLNFMCDLVDAEVHHYNDGSWEIVKILGKHKKDE
mgnify:CR=1 FL=1